VQIKVHIRNYDGTLTFRELSEGEQQLLMVLGLLRFTKEKESLILLDEPDTHLNPYWNVQYLNTLKRIVDDDTDALNPERDTRHIIMSSHDPLVIADLERQQVQILKRDEVMDRCYADIPEMSPRGMGFTGILTSDMFCFRSDLDPHTLALLDKKVELSGREGKLTKEDTDHLEKINEELDQAGLLMAFSDPYYSAFVRAWSQRPELKRFQKRFLTREERRELSAITDEILQEIMEEHEDSEKRGKMAVEIDDPGVAGNKERVIQEETVAISDMIREFWHLETQDPDAAVNRFVILFVHILLQYAQEPSRSRQRIWLRARDIVLEHLRTQVHKSHKFGRISFPLEEQDRSLEMLLDELIQSMNKPDISTPARDEEDDEGFFLKR